MKKIMGVILLLGLCLGITACGNKSVEETTAAPLVTEATPEMEEVPVHVAVVFYGTVEENEAFDTGVRNAIKECGAEYHTMYGVDEESWETQVLQACESGYDYVIGTAPEIADYIAKYEKAYPEITFVTVDAEVVSENVISVFIAHEDAYYQAGVKAAGTVTQPEMEAMEPAVLGWIGGMNIPMIQKYYTSFVQGVKTVDENMQILEKYTGSWDDPDEGYRLAESMHEQGVDVILSVAGDSDAGIVAAAEEYGFKLMNVSNDMQQIGYLVVRKLLQGELEGKAILELSVEDGCVILNEITFEDVNTASNAKA